MSRFNPYLNPHRDDLVLNPGHLANWRAKRAQMDGGSNVVAKVGIWGDSIAEGYYVTSPNLTKTAVQTKSFLGLLNEYYKAKYTDVGWGWIGATSIGGFTSSDEHYWVQDAGVWGTNAYQINGGQGIRFYHATFADAQTSTTFSGTGVDVVFEKVKSGSNDVEILIDGASNQHVNLYKADDPNVVYIVPITGLEDATHTFSIINRQVGKNVIIDGIRPIKGVKGVQFLNYSHTGYASNCLNAVSPQAPDMASKSINLFDHDIAIFQYLINDHGHNIGLPAYIANLKAYIAIALAAGMEVILLPMIPAFSTVNTLGEYRNDYYNAMRQVAMDTGVCLIDLWARWNPQLAKMSDLYLEDGTHPNAVGHYDIYKAILAVLES